MKLNNILNESITDEYKKLAKKFISLRGPASFEIDNNGFINNINNDSTIRLRKTDPDIHNIFDENGVSKLFFGKCEGNFLIGNVSQIKSLKNLPTICNGDFSLRYLDNVEIFDLDIQYHSDVLILGCSIKDVSKIKNVDTLRIAECINIDTFDKLPSYVKNPNEHKTLRISNNSFNNKIKTNNNAINTLKLSKVNKIVNLHNFPTNLSRLDIHDCVDFKSFSGIDKLDNLISFKSDINEYNNIINLLLCKSLSASGLNITHLSSMDVFFIIYSYMKKDLSERADHIMDCAIELIDAGYEEAAEL